MPQGSENLRMAGFKPDGTKDEQIKYFRDLVAEEVSFENSLVEQWQKKLKESGPGSSSPTITEDGADQIRGAIGQSRLFLDKKMQQFVGLIDECEMGNTTTTPTDLAGFWEMIYMQVKNIHDRFEHLDVLAVNGWMTPQKAKSTVDGASANGMKKNGATKKPTANVQASSKIREAIEKARAAKAAAETNKEAQSVDGI
ncbi:disks large-associated protein 5-like [Paramacrobiotus metropolitanus]|uniref:disks large-associated protein 5-like n=1 Tax=Paramacrobiotus metropolitanus TaxID=2943436 RepID=UPI0024457319|nr:disks large-associated protein 5-like [Paramacrobiotus metropolitanus]